MTTALFIFYTSTWQPLADLVLPVAARYCERHGYAKEFICDDGAYGDSIIYKKEMPVGYWKMLKLRELMDKYELIWVLDADCLITNGENDLNFYYPLTTNAAFTEDLNGINAGSWIATNTTACKMFVDMVINDFDAPEEQTVMKRYLALLYPYTIIGHPSINSYLYTEYLNDWDDKVGKGKPMPTHEQGFWKPGDFVLHLPGLSCQRRIEIFKQIIEQL